MSPVRPAVWIVGPAPWTRGGVAAVTRLLLASSLATRFRLRAMPTYVAGGLWTRCFWAASGLARVGLGLVVAPPALVHLEVASRASFFRKLAVAALCRVRGVPLVVHVHGGGFDGFLRRSPGWVRRAARWMIESAPAAVTLSPARLAALEPLLPGASWTVVPNPVETRALEALAEERLARRPAEPGGDLRLLFLGDVRERKGVAEALRALADLAVVLPGLRLTIAGPGEIARFRRFAEELGVTARVEFPGWVGEAEKRALLRQADIFLLPSHVEGVPLALLEAMASGLPSVVTPVGGVLDAAIAEETSLVVPPGDAAALGAAVARLAADAELRRRLGAAARARSHSFDVEVVAQRLDALYARILRGGAHA